MRSTQRRYHFAVKGLLRSQTDLRNAYLAAASINKPPNVFWREFKRANARPSSVQVSNVVNGHTDCHDIANEFKNAYSDIFRAGFTTVEDLEVLQYNRPAQQHQASHLHIPRVDCQWNASLKIHASQDYYGYFWLSVTAKHHSQLIPSIYMQLINK